VQDAHAVANHFHGEHLAVVALQRLARQHRRLDLEDEVARLHRGVVEADPFLARVAAQEHRLGVQQSTLARQGDLDLAIAVAPVAQDRLQFDGRAHEGKIIGQHGGDR